MTTRCASQSSAAGLVLLLLVLANLAATTLASPRLLLQGGGDGTGGDDDGTGGGGGGTPGRPSPMVVGSTCSSTADLQGCCARKAQQGTCLADPSCLSPRDLCGEGPTPPGPAPGSQCVSTGPSNYVTCCQRKARGTDPSCPPPRCGAITGISAADLQTCCTVLKPAGTDPTCPRPPPTPAPTPIVVVPVATNVTCFNMTATLQGLAAVQSSTNQQMNQTSDVTKLRSIAATGLQQMYDYVRNASTAVPVAGTSFTG